MDSHEEKLHCMIEQCKISEAKEVAKRKHHEFAKQRAAAGKEPNMPNMPNMNIVSNMSVPAQQAPIMSSTVVSPCEPAQYKAPVKGLQLGKKPLTFGSPSTATVSPIIQAPEVAPIAEPCEVLLQEKMLINVEPDGGVTEVNISGQMALTVYQPAKADLVCFKIAYPTDSKFKTKTHPGLNKVSFGQNLLEVRDSSRPFTPNTVLPLLKWSSKSNDLQNSPISVSFWPSPNPDGTSGIVEFEIQEGIVMQNVQAIIPLSNTARAQVISVTIGECRITDDKLFWNIPVVDGSSPELSSGTLEFSARMDQSNLLPFTIEGTAAKIISDVNIFEAFHQATKDPVEYQLTTECQVVVTVCG
eukprot:GHVL01034993.1.p1 GENE.GHVL01034993.1~~GHVL01034993.1.p1  ORF type:complete len:357 (+),score=75.29 GHVL01034993.1:342-1412(+)